MAILEIKNLTKRFGGLTVLEDVNLDVQEGEILGLIGPNGAGKTTLFNVIAGVHKPTSGKIFLGGDEISGLTPSEVARRGIIKTYQANVSFRNLTVEQNILVGHHLQVKAGLLGTFFNSPLARADTERVSSGTVAIFTYFGLQHRKNELAGKLPHGYQRLLGIATAIAAKPRVLLLDEPITGMNSEEALQTVELIRGLRKEGTTVVIIEHDMKVVMNLCERIFVINFGKKIAEGIPREIRENPRVIEAYLGIE
jgi:branched-chain amino acid transport system ATP-binding protein